MSERENRGSMSELISIVMSVFNESESEILEAINSCLNQTYENIEILLVNDNPERFSEAGFQQFQLDERIVLVRNKNNMGLALSVNKALRLANGSYVARMDADDISDKFRIEKEYNYVAPILA